MAKTPIEKLESAITKILDNYSDDIDANLDLITKAMGQKGATALRQQSASTFKQHSGKYAKGWKYDYRKVRRYAQTTIYNEHYGMPHLLENGHVIRNGTGRSYGTYPGKEHIKPVADQLIDTYQSEVISKL